MGRDISSPTLMWSFLWSWCAQIKVWAVSAGIWPSSLEQKWHSSIVIASCFHLDERKHQSMRHVQGVNARMSKNALVFTFSSFAHSFRVKNESIITDSWFGYFYVAVGMSCIETCRLHVSRDVGDSTSLKPSPLHLERLLLQIQVVIQQSERAKEHCWYSCTAVFWFNRTITEIKVRLKRYEKCAWQKTTSNRLLHHDSISPLALIIVLYLAIRTRNKLAGWTNVP